MKDINREELYKTVIKTWGIDLQIIVAIEELSELQKELTKSLRSGYSTVGIAEEIADVKIMLEQLEMIFGIEGHVEYWKGLKLFKLEKKLQEAIIFNEAIEDVIDKEEE